MFRRISESFTRFLAQNNNPLGLVVLGISAFLEYVFPPFPGDTVTLFGALLVARHQWSALWVFVAVLAGSGAGSMLDYYIGTRFARRYHQGKLIQNPKLRKRVERVLAAFQRFGPAYVAINRFLPGVRAVIFIAAGMASLPGAQVLLFALLSAAIWNAAILAIGFTVGANWTKLKQFFAQYGLFSWFAIALALILWLVLQLLRERQRRSASSAARERETPELPP